MEVVQKIPTMHTNVSHFLVALLPCGNPLWLATSKSSAAAAQIRVGRSGTLIRSA